MNEQIEKRVVREKIIDKYFSVFLKSLSTIYLRSRKNGQLYLSRIIAPGNVKYFIKPVKLHQVNLIDRERKAL